MINFRKILGFKTFEPHKQPELASSTSPKILLSERALAQMMFYLSAIKSEFGFAMEGRRAGLAVYVDNIFVPSQSATDVYWEQAYPDGIDEVYLHFKDTPGVTQVGWGHSHCAFGAFHSDVDINTTKTNGQMLKIPSASLTISRLNKDMFDGRVCVEDGDGVRVVEAEVVLPFKSETHKISSMANHGYSAGEFQQ